MALKYENTAEVGDFIKAFDHQPREGVDCWVIGRVVRKGRTPGGFDGYEIQADSSSHGQYLDNATVFVPFQISPLEYDGRVTLTMEAAEYREILHDHAEDLAGEY